MHLLGAAECVVTACVFVITVNTIYLMDNVFAKDVSIHDQLIKFADFNASYMADTLIFRDTMDEHLTHIIVSLNQLRQCGLYVLPLKCEWLQTSILVLGHRTTSQRRIADPNRVNILQSKDIMASSYQSLRAEVLVGNLWVLAYLCKRLYKR
jgi:hypothetical protein